MINKHLLNKYITFTGIFYLVHEGEQLNHCNYSSYYFSESNQQRFYLLFFSSGLGCFPCFAIFFLNDHYLVHFVLDLTICLLFKEASIAFVKIDKKTARSLRKHNTEFFFHNSSTSKHNSQVTDVLLF